MRGRLVEVLLLTIASAMLFSTVTYGFHIEDSLRTAYVAIIAIPLALTIYFTAISYSPRSIIVGSIAFVVAFGVASVALGAMTGHAFFYDEYGNVGFFLLLGVLTTTVGYVMTRRKVPCIVYAVGGCFTCGLIQFLYVNDLVVQAIVFLADAICLCVVCVNRVASKRIASDDVPAWRFMATGVGIAAIAVVFACAVFALVIAPLDPPGQEIKIFTEYFALETVHVRGDKAVEHKENDDLVSNEEEQGDKQTNESNDNTEDVSGDYADDSQTGDAGDDDFGGSGSNVTGFGESTQAVSYLNESARWLLAIPLILLLVIMLFVGKLALRRYRYRKMVALPARERVVAFYVFFDKRLPKLGIHRDVAATPYEHVNNVASTLSLLERDAAGATYLQLTQAYCECVYGNDAPGAHEETNGASEQDSLTVDCCQNLYKVFYRNARKLVGIPRYLLLFFRL